MPDQNRNRNPPDQNRNQIESEERDVTENQFEIEQRDVAENPIEIVERDVAENPIEIVERDVTENQIEIKERDVAENQIKIEERVVAENKIGIEERDVAENRIGIKERDVAEDQIEIEERHVAEDQIGIEEHSVAENQIENEERHVAEYQIEIEERDAAENGNEIDRLSALLGLPIRKSRAPGPRPDYSLTIFYHPITRLTRESREKLRDVDGNILIGTGRTVILTKRFNKVNWRNYITLTVTLLNAIFPRKTLATHNLTGCPYYPHLPRRPRLNPLKVNDIIITVTSTFRVPQVRVRHVISEKCLAEAIAAGALRIWPQILPIVPQRVIGARIQLPAMPPRLPGVLQLMPEMVMPVDERDPEEAIFDLYENLLNVSPRAAG